jgi:hypothetical protein
MMMVPRFDRSDENEDDSTEYHVEICRVSIHKIDNMEV